MMKTEALRRRERRQTFMTVLFTVISVLYLMPVVLVLINSLKANAFVNTETFKLPTAESFVGLNALADPDDRDPGGDCYVESLELQDVQFGVNSAGTFVFFTEKSRSDISAARQDQSVAGNDLSGNQSSHDLRGKCTEKGFIISCFGLAPQND